MGQTTIGDRVVFSANARYGAGGQGEFLRLMVHALVPEPGATVYSRFVPPNLIHAGNLPFAAGSTRRQLFRLIEQVPGLRGRQDWLTLLSDVEFDARVAAAIDPPALFDGITAQCLRTIDRLRTRRTGGASTRVIVTCLNTHITHLVRRLDEEHRLIGCRGPSFVHPRMHARALREIAAADHLRVNSALAKRTFVDEGVPPERISVIYPGIDLGHFHPVSKTDDVFRVLAISSINPRKGVHYLLQAFEAAKLANAELVIIGGTGDSWSKRMLASFMARDARITCRAVDIMQADATGIFGPASVLVHAAIEDGFGLVVPQALASGRPVIVTRATGAAELVRHGVTGFVVDARSVTQIADALRLLAHDRDLWTTMCARGRPSVEGRSYAVFGEEVRAMYRRVRGQADGG